MSAPRPSPPVEVSGDLLQMDGRAAYIVHQCNCVSRGAAGLARALFALRPDADVYRARAGPSALGAIAVAPPAGGRPGVVALFAQVRPGRAGAPGDDPRARLAAFRACLGALARALQAGGMAGGPVAFPWHIGCGLAGGHWPDYAAAIAEFAAAVPGPVLLVRRPGDA